MSLIVASSEAQKGALGDAIRALLTPAQQTVFDRNVAQAKERFEKRGERFKEQRRS